MENWSETLARILRNKPKSRAAVTKAGPRLAELAGSASLRDALRWNERFDFAGMRSSDQPSFENNLLSRCGPPFLHQPERRIRRSSRDDDISCNDRLGMDHHPVRNPKESGDRLDPAQFRRIFRKVRNRKHRRGDPAYSIEHKHSRSLPRSSASRLFENFQYCFYICTQHYRSALLLFQNCRFIFLVWKQISAMKLNGEIRILQHVSGQDEHDELIGFDEALLY